MGTQQLLLIVIGVIIVAAAIATGITMFNNHEFAANRQAVLAEMQGMMARVNEFWKLPKSMGGAGQNMSETDVIDLANFLGFTAGESKVVHEYFYSSINGTFYLSNFTDYVITMEGLGFSSKGGEYPLVEMDYSLITQEMDVEVSKGKTFKGGQGHGQGGGNSGNGGGNGGGDGAGGSGHGGGNGKP